MRGVIRYLLDCTLCPPRATYDPNDTISAITTENGPVFERHNVEFKTGIDLTMTGSLWKMKCPDKKPRSCCIYLHSLGTNQFEVINIVPFLCTDRLCLFAFDFPGCGLSQGDATPLDGSGCQIVLDAVRYISEHFDIHDFALWGRSMGAAIALHTASISDAFSCVVSDSAFECTRKIVTDQAHLNHIPVCLINLAFRIFKEAAMEELNLDIDSPFPGEYVASSKTPLLMGHGRSDTFVLPSHARHLFDKYGCRNKQLYLFKGKHNSTRPRQWYETVGRFIYRHCGIKDKVRAYNLVYASSHLHVGELNLVLSEIEAKRIADAEAAAKLANPTEPPPEQTPPPPPPEETEPEKKHRKHHRHRHHHRRHKHKHAEEEENDEAAVLSAHYHELQDFNDINAVVYP